MSHVSAPSPALSEPPLALYVHFPWCVRKCPYCDFNSHPLRGTRKDLPERAYVDQLLGDLAVALEWAGTRPIRSVFLGGGTPSLFSPHEIARLLAGVGESAELEPDAEITLEANPGAVDQAHFEGYRAAGVNRLSLGVQSFNARHLDALGRVHSVGQVYAALDAARRAGFRRINIDLMHGLPRQTATEALADLDAAIATGVGHVSWYQLTIEPKTEFALRPPTLPDESCLADIEAAGLERLAAEGYARYEISAFAKPGDEARHNLNYWRFGDYLGIGAGAHGKLTFPAQNRIVRSSKPQQPRLYLAAAPQALRRETTVEPDERAGEFMLNALRLVDGVPFELFSRRTGLAFSAIGPRWQALIERGLARRDRLGLAAQGLRHLDTIVADFL